MCTAHSFTLHKPIPLFNYYSESKQLSLDPESFDPIYDSLHAAHCTKLYCTHINCIILRASNSHFVQQSASIRSITNCRKPYSIRVKCITCSSWLLLVISWTKEHQSATENCSIGRQLTARLHLLGSLMTPPRQLDYTPLAAWLHPLGSIWVRYYLTPQWHNTPLAL